MDKCHHLTADSSQAPNIVTARRGRHQTIRTFDCCRPAKTPSSKKRFLVTPNPSAEGWLRRASIASKNGGFLIGSKYFDRRHEFLRLCGSPFLRAVVNTAEVSELQFRAAGKLTAASSR